MKTQLKIEKHPAESLTKYFFKDHPIDAARMLSLMPAQKAAAIIQKQSREILVTLWGYLTPYAQEKLIPILPSEIKKVILAAVDPGIIAILLAKITEIERKNLLALLEPQLAQELEELIEYPGRTAGYLMDSNIICLHHTITVKQALEYIRAEKQFDLSYLFAVDSKFKLIGQIDLRKLIFAEEHQSISEIIIPLMVSVNALDLEADVISKLEKYRLEFIPVLDPHQRFLGVIHSSKIIEAVKEEITGDIQAMVGVSKDEQAFSSSWFSVKKRLPWLQVNLITAFLAAAVVGLFEDIIAQYSTLAILLPIASGQAGNAGAQALAVTMRGLALKEISLRHWLKLVFKETKTGFINGLAVAITCSFGVYLWSKVFGLAVIIFLAMIVSMTIAGVFGALIPIGLKRLGQDPAQASSIVLTTITDIVGFFSFLGIASLLAYML